MTSYLGVCTIPSCTLCNPKDTMNYRPPRYLLLRINADRTVTVVGQYDSLPDQEDIENACGLNDDDTFALIDTQGFVANYYKVVIERTLICTVPTA